MKYLQLFEGWINEALTSDPIKIANEIQVACAGLGTTEPSLAKAILSIPDVLTMNKVNQALNSGFKTKDWAYASVGDAINGELGIFDQSYKTQIDNHIANIQVQNSLGTFVAPPPSTDQVVSSIKDRVIQHEGKKYIKYLDTKKNPTIGVGFNLNREDSSVLLKRVGANPAKIKAGKAKLTDAQISTLLNNDLIQAKNDAQTLISEDGSVNISKVWPTLPLSVQGVLTEMVFNLGKAGLAKFNKFLKYILSNKYKEASTEMLDSEWAGQVKNRANNLSQIIKSATRLARVSNRSILTEYNILNK